jgi:hypothetical protein
MFITRSQTEINLDALQKAVLQKLAKLKDRAIYLIETETYRNFWQDWHATIVAVPDQVMKERYLGVESQLKNLSRFIEGFIMTSVDTKERLEFFVLAKAQEISSGDTERDYYWAMHIRQDQLIALIRVLSRLLDHLRILVKMPAAEVMDDPVILGLLEYSVEDQVYLEAEKVHEEAT